MLSHLLRLLDDVRDRPCDCPEYHLEHMPVPPRVTFLNDLPIGRVIRTRPAKHRHDNDQCTRTSLGVGGCRGEGTCRQHIVGAYLAGETLCEVMGDEDGAQFRRSARMAFEWTGVMHQRESLAL